MRYVVLTAGLVVAAAGPVRADEADAKAARALVDKAVKAHGGQANLAKFPASVAKFKGTFHGQGTPIPMAGEITTFGPDKAKLDLEIDAGGMKIPVVNVVAGDKGWAKVGDNVVELNKDQMTEALEQGHGGWVSSLAPLSGKGFTLATAGELLVNDKPALGVKASYKGRRDVTLYFDKVTGRVVKVETTVKDEGTGQEVTEEAFPSDYKEVQGTQQAMKFTTKRDGKLYLEGELSEITLADKIDAGVFVKP